jgi:hypothetical protein
VTRVEGEVEARVPYWDEERGTDGSRTLKLPRKVWIRRCDFHGIEGYSNAFTENQRYVYFENDRAEDEGECYSWRGAVQRYIQVGVPSRSTAGQSPVFGRRRAYFDPCF